jgi:hypothetical protein
VTVDEQGARVVVSFDSPAGRHERREIEPPADVRAAEKDIALLAMNLVRDQAAGFLSAGTPTPDRPASPAPEVVSPPESAGSSAPTATPRGLELGASTTIGTPVGAMGGDIRAIFSYMASIRADAGYRVTPRFYLGAYFTYGLPSLGVSCHGLSPPYPSCAVTEIAAGLGFAYDANPASSLSWWIGAGLGFEWTSVRWEGSERGSAPVGPTGIEFKTGVDFTGLGVSQFQIGLDYKPTPRLRLGPFFESALGGYELVKVYTSNGPPHAADPAAALSAWDDYLSAYPAGRFAPDAHYNRAIVLLKLQRFSEARQALEPFARGDYGAYHVDEARALLQSLP